MTKAEWREVLHLRVQRLGRREERDQQICDLLSSQIQAGTWGVYKAYPSEPSLQSLMTQVSKQHPEVRWCFPEVVGEDMVFRAQGQTVPPEQITGLLIPGRGFDKWGVRLGRGRGFYDRFLVKFQGHKWGVAYDVCWVEDLPHDAHDVKMDCVWTESGRKLWPLLSPSS